MIETTEIDTTSKRPPPDKDKREFRAAVRSLCVWVVVFAFCFVFGFMGNLVVDFGSAVAFMVILPFAAVYLFVSIYKIGEAILNLYKHRRGDSSPS